MRKTRIWLIIATSLILLGSIIFASVMSVLQWDFTKLSTVKYETNDYEIVENYSNITIVTDTADVVFAVSEDSKHLVSCYEQEKVKHSVSVSNDTLTIKVDGTKKRVYVGVNFITPKITVTIPQGEYGALSINSYTGDVKIPKAFRFTSMDISEATGDVTNYASVSGTVKIKTDTGDVYMENVSASAVSVSVSTGKVSVAGLVCAGDVTVGVSTGKAYLTGVDCKNLTTTGSTGDIVLKKVIATGKFSIKRNTGDVTFDGSDAAEIFVETDTGDVTGTLLSEKVFTTRTDTGKIDVPKTTSGGRCEIATDTGDIKLKIVENG